MALLTQRKVCLVGHILYEKYVKKKIEKNLTECSFLH